jgi:AcrR family transcriptional regulator
MPARGQTTRQQILDRALSAASTRGLTGLTIGHLARAVGMSKSGLFAHFNSKQQLQLDVLHEAVDRFIDAVVVPAIQKPRGEPRIRELFKRWLHWNEAPYLPGGCPLVAASIELDDQEGPVRDFLVSSQRDWLSTLARAAGIALEERHFQPALDPQQFAFELHALMLGYHFQHRLLRQDQARQRVQRAFDRLLEQARGPIP